MKPPQKTALIGLLTAAAVSLSFLETLLPAFPFLPQGAKAGFTNSNTLIAFCFMGLVPALTIAVLKSVFVLLTRGLTAFFMSLCGGLFSALVMFICIRLKGSLFCMGVTGAIAHNIAQLIVALGITGTPGLLYYAPLLLLFALIAGTITGFLLKLTYVPLCTLAERVIPLQK